MATNGKFLSKDGQWYDTAQEMWSANAAWNEKQGIQKEQNRLIQQQNQLLEQQSMLNYQLEQEKIQKNYELEINKMKHEEKMRLLKLFDDVGISKETYDNYITKSILNKETEKLQAKRNEHLLMSSKYDFLLQEEKYKNELGYDVYDSTMEKYDLYDLKVKLMDNECYDKVSKSKQKKIDELKIMEKKSKDIFGVFFGICFFILLLNCIFGLWNKLWLLWVITIIPVVVTYKIYGKYFDMLKEISKVEFDEKKYKSKLNELILQENDAANKLIDTIQSNNEQQVNDLYNFRVKHYNASVEKLLIDVGFKRLIESLGLEYKKVNNRNKEKDGTIEDYVEYFETNS